MIQAITPGHIGVMFACIVALMMPVTAAANDVLRRSLSGEDHEMINAGNLEYNRCLQKQAMAHADDYDDVRAVAGQAVEECTGILDNLKSDLDQRRIDPDFYDGIINGIKSKAIRRIMPGIMMHKSRSGSPTP
ncbi:MAG: hypothetical protein WD750_04670 [Gammaproteobacteria bacterium]